MFENNGLIPSSSPVSQAFACDDDVIDAVVAGVASTLLDPLETSRQNGDHPPKSQPATRLDDLEPLIVRETLAATFRHSGWRARRQAVYAAMQAVEAPQSRLRAFAACGANCYVLQSDLDPTDFRLAASTCHDRFCLPCAQTRSKVIAANVAERLGNTVCRFFTFTLRHRDAPLADLIDALYAAFTDLRRHPFWRKSQKGGIAFLEVKRSHDGLTWHPHLHVLGQGKFIDNKKLANVWHSITGDSFIVDVRLVRRNDDAIRYVTKYASKPFDPSLFRDPNALALAVHGLASRRMVKTYGSWRGLKTTSQPSTTGWHIVDTLEGLAVAAAKGDAYAARLLYHLTGDHAPYLIGHAMLLSPPARSPPTLSPVDPQLEFLL